MLNEFKNAVFKIRHGFRGYPRRIRGVPFRFHESLRRFVTDGECAIQETLESYLRAGSVFVDVGANFGLHSLLGCHLVGGNGKVIAIEPVPANARLLRRNSSLNRFGDRCEILEHALTAKGEGQVKMTIEEGCSPAASLGATYGGEQILVKTMTLDQALRNIVKPPDLIKIDVEGAEHEVLRGAEKTLHSGAPLLIEVHRFGLGEFGSSTEEMNEFLSEFGNVEERLTEMESKLGEYHHSLYTIQ